MDNRTMTKIIASPTPKGGGPPERDVEPAFDGVSCAAANLH